MTIGLLNKIRPHQMYTAGDLSDPHGTHRAYLAAIFAAGQALKAEGAPRRADYRAWLYRGAWQERDVAETEVAAPLSPEELTRERRAIFKPQSQKDRPPLPGANQRVVWQRAEERNRPTARLYDQPDPPEYEAIEGVCTVLLLRSDSQKKSVMLRCALHDNRY